MIILGVYQTPAGIENTEGIYRSDIVRDLVRLLPSLYKTHPDLVNVIEGCGLPEFSGSRREVRGLGHGFAEGRLGGMPIRDVADPKGMPRTVICSLTSGAFFFRVTLKNPNFSLDLAALRENNVVNSCLAQFSFSVPAPGWGSRVLRIRGG
jgi:hypothetical protein